MLTGKQVKELEQALQSAYPNRAQLKRMVRYKLDKRLTEIAGGENQSEIVFNLIEWAEAQGRIEELIQKSHAYNVGNAQLSAFVSQFFASQPSASQPPALEATSLPPIPPVAPQLFGREHFLNELVEELAAQAREQGGGMAYRIALRGMAGVGKTALAKAVANHEQVGQAFPDGRAWLSLGHQPDVFLLLGR